MVNYLPWNGVLHCPVSTIVNGTYESRGTERGPVTGEDGSAAEADGGSRKAESSPGKVKDPVVKDSSAEAEEGSAMKAEDSVNAEDSSGKAKGPVVKDSSGKAEDDGPAVNDGSVKGKLAARW